ncbi:MAG: galactose mutarotase [Reichenbachiella sp.]
MKKTIFILTFATLGLMTWSCETSKEVRFEITQSVFGIMPDGQEATLFSINTPRGSKLNITNYGGIITALEVPDRNGNLGDVVLGYDTLSSYLAGSPYFGAIIGRYGNRIANGQFVIDSVTYTLDSNDGVNHLHGGTIGYDKVLWNAKPFINADNAGVIFTRTSPNLEEGYPGDLPCEVTYTFDSNNKVTFEYKASTNKKTVVNLTNHSYFNLTGDPTQTINGHELTLPASKFLPVNEGLIPTGQLKKVNDTPFDFLNPMTIGKRVNDENVQLVFGQGYDHCWVYDDQSDSLKFGGSLYDPVSGREMKIYTMEPAIQFYGGNFLNGSNIGKEDIAYQHRTGLCLETQHYPDSPNQSSFPSTTLEPGETYYTKSIYEFSNR